MSDVIKGDLIAPFSLHSSSVTDGYQSVVSSSFAPNVAIEGIHADGFVETPMQGPFTNSHVGGMQHRHVSINDGEDDESNRGESFRIILQNNQLKVGGAHISSQGYIDLQLPRLNLSREEFAKRPVNVKNIQYGTGSSELGNYRFDYEIVQSDAAKTDFVDAEGYAASLYCPFLNIDQDYTKVERGTKKHFIIERFAAPGDEWTMGDANGGQGLDPETARFSPNVVQPWRNHLIRASFNLSSSQENDDFGTLDGVVASVHKVNKNNRRYIREQNGSYDEMLKHDNAFVSHPIPAEEERYAWINGKLESSFYGYQHNEDDLHFISSSGGYFGPASDGYFQDGPFLRRGGNFGWNTWNQTRTGEHRRVRGLREENQYPLFIQSAPRLNPYIHDQISSKTDGTFFIFTEAPFTTRHEPIVLSLKVSGTLEYYRFDFANDNEYFANEEPNLYLGFVDKKNPTYEYLKDQYASSSFHSLTYRQRIWPQNKNGSLTNMRDSFTVDWWRDEREDRDEIRNGSGHVYSEYVNPFGTGSLSTSIWPLDGRADYATANSFDVTGSTSLDLLEYGGEGTLQQRSTIYLACASNDYVNKITPIVQTPIYARRHVQKTNTTADGDTEWLAGAQAGKNPFCYASYDEYVEDLKRKGKEYSIIPEYRISEHIEKYLTTFKGSFLRRDTGSLTIHGNSLDSSEDPTFMETYSYSDALKHFRIIEKEHEGIANKKELTLSCKGLMRLIPYEGFYPVQRTLQLATLFSQSYSPYCQGWGMEHTTSDSLYNARSSNYKGRSFWQAFFAPGIMYNTIKSGIAVDYPIMTSNFNITGSLMGAETSNLSCNLTGFLNPSLQTPDSAESRIKDNFHYRVPFEALLSPESYLGGKNIVDSEAHSSSICFQWKGDVPSILSSSIPSFKVDSPLYTMAMSNFLAASMDIFLKDSRPTSFVSLPDSHPGFGLVEPGKMYAMEVIIRRDENFIMYKSGSAFGPPIDASVLSSFDSSSLMQYTGSSYAPFTPPYFDKGVANRYGRNIQPEGKALLTFTPYKEGSNRYTLDEILPYVEVVCLSDDYRGRAVVGRDDEGTEFNSRGSIIQVQGGPQLEIIRVRSYAEDNAMQIISSVNVKQSSIFRKKEYEALTGKQLTLTEDPDNAWYWVIQPKYETIALDFANAEETIPTEGTAGQLGMWHQYGTLPQTGKGLMLEIRDYTTKEDRNSPSGTIQVNTNLTGSLADLVGFEKGVKDLGRPRDGFTISEAIVAIPYLEIGKEKKFIELDQELITASDIGLRDGIPSVKNMLNLMREFVFPPNMDFVKNKSVTPFLMYIFPFRHKLSQTDLTDWWQNLPPEIATKFEHEEVSVSHDFSLLGDINISDLRWMVFKVKQRMKTNYFEKVINSAEDEKLKEIAGVIGDYAPNWPADFMSLVELGHIEAEAVLKKED